MTTNVLSGDAQFPADLDAVVARAVLNGDRPVKYVAHTPDDDWWVSDGVTDPDDANAHVVAHIRHIVERDPTVEQLANLPLGREARREATEDAWTVAVFDWADS